MSRAAFSLQALAMRGGAASRDRALVVSPALPPGPLHFPHFDRPALVVSPREAAEQAERASDASRFDLVVLDAVGDDLTQVEMALRLVAPGGLVMLIDRTRSMLATVRQTPWAFGVGQAPTYLRPRIAKRLASGGFTQQAAFFVEPTVARVRHVVERGFQSEIPGLPDRAWKEWLLKSGGFYLQPRHRVATAAGPSRVAAIDDAIRQTAGNTGAPQVASARIRQCLLSGTNVLMFKVRDDRGQSAFFRFPLETQALSRVEHHHSLLVHVQAAGFTLAPQPLGRGRAAGFPFFAERAMTGRSVSRALPAMPVPTLQAHFDAALRAFEALHVSTGTTQTFDDGRFERYVGTRVDAVRRCIDARGGDCGPVMRAAAWLRQQTLGSRVRVGTSHGDAKISNCLFDDTRVVGVIDWDMSEADGLCAVDVGGLALNTLLKRRGDPVSQMLRHEPELYGALTASIAAYHARANTSMWGFKEMALLYWLDRVARHEAFDRVTDQWFELYVKPVVAELERDMTAR